MLSLSNLPFRHPILRHLFISGLILLGFISPHAYGASFEFELNGTEFESIDTQVETLTVPFAGPIGGPVPDTTNPASTATSIANYSDLVVIKVSGSGVARSASENDAFYDDLTGTPGVDPAAYQLAIDQSPIVLDTIGAPNSTEQLARSLIVYTFEDGNERQIFEPPYAPPLSADTIYAFVVDLSLVRRWNGGSESPAPDAVHFAVADFLENPTAAGYADNSGEFTIDIIPTRVVTTPSATPIPVLIQAVPDPDDDNRLAVALAVSNAPQGNFTVGLESGDNCDATGQIVGDSTFFANVDIPVNANGNGFVLTPVTNEGEDRPGRFLRVAIERPDQPPLTSNCALVQADNDSWTRAQEIGLQDSGGGTLRGFATTSLDSPGNQRWFKVPVRPGNTLDININAGEVDFRRDYDLYVFRDVRATFQDLVGNNDVDGLNQLSAEFAPSIFSPSIFSPSIFSPSIFSPDAYAPSIFSPSIFSPSIFSPSIFSPSIFSPSIFSPSIFSPSIFSPSIFSPSIFSPSIFNPSSSSPSIFSPENFANALTRSLVTVSASRGLGNERVVVDTWQNTGFYYVLVAGKNGQFDVSQTISVEVETDGVSCNGVDPIPGTVTADAGAYESLIFWDSSRMDLSQPGNSGAEMAAFEAAMATLAARPEVKGKIIDLAEIEHIQQLQTQADANAACPYAANLAATAIRDVVGAYRAENPDLAYIVLAGNDNQIPFFRYPDQALLGPEQDYDPPVADGTQSQSALRLNYVLGQDEYGSATNLLLGDSRFPIPNLAVGRLVETAAEMTTVINAYLSTEEGVIDTPESTLVTGYDFLTDAANGVQSELVAGTLDARNDTLVTAADISPADPRSWNADDLRRELLEGREDIVFLAGHFSANSTLAADYTTTALATELDNSTIDLTNVLVFSAGCHSGYNIVNEHSVERLTEPRDWTQAFAAKGATLIAGTGYQYGDTDFVEYSERLYVQFARELRVGTGPVAIGDALVNAKQRYLSQTPDVRGLHRKSIIIATLFGLPMIKVDMPGDRLPTSSVAADIVTEPVTGNPGATLGLESAQLSFDFGGQLIPTTLDLNNLDGGTLQATYLRGPNGVVTHPAEPAIPLSSSDVSVAGKSLRGVGFRSGDWTERRVIPLTGAPTTELRGVHTPFTSPLNFPLRLWNSNYFGALAGGSTILHVTPAQHRVDNIGDVEATLREFTSMDFELFYSSNTQTFGANRPALSSAPSFANIRALVDGNDILFQARAVGDPAAGIQKVWVTFTDGGDPAGTGRWASLDLVQSPNDSTAWGVRLPNALNNFTRLDFFVQAVNGVGLVTLDDNFGAYYQIAGTEENTAPDGTPLNLLRTRIDSVSQTPDDEQPFGETKQLQATLNDEEGEPIEGARLLFSVGASGRTATTDSQGIATANLPLNILPGEYQVQISFAGNSTYAATTRNAFIEVIKADTQLEVVSEPPIVEEDGVRTRLGVRLLDGNGSPLLQRTVYFTVEGPQGTQTFPIITDNIGRAALGKRDLPPGTYTITARFLGAIPDSTLELTDEVYNASVTEPVQLVIDPPAPVLDAPLSCERNLSYWRPWRSTVVVGYEPGTKSRDLPKFTLLFSSDDPDRNAFAAVSKRWGRYKKRTGELTLRTGFWSFFTRNIAAKDKEGNQSERIACH